MSDVHQPERWPVPGLSPDLTPNRLGRMLLRTMYYSFAASQGAGQRALIELAGHMYTSMYSPDKLAAAFATVGPDQVVMNLPSGHGPVMNADMKNHPTMPGEPEASHAIGVEFRGAWRSLSHAAKARYETPYDPSNILVRRGLAQVIDELVGRDRYFLSETITVDGAGVPFVGRPVRKPGDDPRKSFIRENVIGGLTVRDAVIDRIIGDAGEMLLGDSLPPVPSNDTFRAGQRAATYASLPGIVTAWEKFHPGEQFAAPGVLPDSFRPPTA